MKKTRCFLLSVSLPESSPRQPALQSNLNQGHKAGTVHSSGCQNRSWSAVLDGPTGKAGGIGGQAST